MKSVRLLGSLALTLALASPALTHTHKAMHSIERFVEAWNAHDSAQMAKRFTVDATAVDPLGRSAKGRNEVAGLFVKGDSRLRLTSDNSVRQVGERAGVDERDIGLVGTVEFEGEISGMLSPEGVLLPAFTRRFTAVLVWAPDLPGGDHPGGRYFIASMRLGSPSR